VDEGSMLSVSKLKRDLSSCDGLGTEGDGEDTILEFMEDELEMVDEG
jgi:hypothetical protein